VTIDPDHDPVSSVTNKKSIKKMKESHCL